jgi:hypothetical protein
MTWSKKKGKVAAAHPNAATFLFSEFNLGYDFFIFAHYFH